MSFVNCPATPNIEFIKINRDAEVAICLGLILIRFKKKFPLSSIKKKIGLKRLSKTISFVICEKKDALFV